MFITYYSFFASVYQNIYSFHIECTLVKQNNGMLHTKTILVLSSVIYAYRLILILVFGLVRTSFKSKPSNF